MKEQLKKLLKLSPIPLSKNHRYDKQTQKIAKTSLSEHSCTVDVGCHKGEILDLFMKYAPAGRHFGFEPIPDLYSKLVDRYSSYTPDVTISDVALSDTKGSASFNYVVTNPSYSGLIKRSYDKAGEKDTKITVQTDRLDAILPLDVDVDMIKIDVEGGELGVLQGAKETIIRCQPVVIFEHGKGASEHYGTTPADIYRFFESVGLGIFTLTAYLKKKKPLTREELEAQYHKQINYYFVAVPLG